MSNSDLFSMAIRNLFKRKLRTILTILGVVIGSSSIIMMVSLGVGMNVSFEERIKDYGNITVVNVQSQAYWDPNAAVLDDKALLEFEKIEGVDAVTPIITGDFSLASGKYQGWGQIMGMDMSLFESLGYKLESGRLPDEADKNGVVFGGNVTEGFYNPKSRNPWLNPPQLDPYEDEFELLISNIQDESSKKYIVKPQPITVTGVLPRGGMEGNGVFMDIDVVRALNAEKKKAEDKYYKAQGQNNNQRRDEDKGYSDARVKCKNIDVVAAVVEEISNRGYSAWGMGDWISAEKKTSESLQALLGAIGAVSLLVAAIGIANTMLMSIYERTREIGVMKVIGATISDIRRLFLVEAALIGFIGGLAGIAISLALSYLLNTTDLLAFLNPDSGWNADAAAQKVSIIPMWLCALGLSFSTVVGIISGFFPARRATKLSALAAIRAE